MQAHGLLNSPVFYAHYNLSTTPTHSFIHHHNHNRVTAMICQPPWLLAHGTLLCLYVTLIIHSWAMAHDKKNGCHYIISQLTCQWHKILSCQISQTGMLVPKDTLELFAVQYSDILCQLLFWHTCRTY